MFISRLFLILIVCVCSIFSSLAQIKDGTYQGARVIKKKVQSKTIEIHVRALGNESSIFTTVDRVSRHKPLEGCYHIEINRFGKGAIGNFKKGFPEGAWVEYSDGRMSGKFNFKNGKPDGENYGYSHNDGELSYLYLYKEGVIQSATEYYSTGEVWVKHSFNQQGILRQTLNFSKSGEVTAEINYANGRIHGKNIKTLDNGCQETKMYNEGEAEGDYLLAYPNGSKKVEGRFDKNEKKDGKWSYWLENGELKAIEHFQNGKLHGEKLQYYPGEQLYIVENYVDDKLGGKWIEYEQNPHMILTEAEYKKGKLDGIYKAYHSGQLWRDCIYREGKLISEKEYKNGKINVLRLVDDSGRLVDFQKYNESGKSFYKNKSYKKPSTITLKEDVSGIIDIVYE